MSHLTKDFDLSWMKKLAVVVLVVVLCGLCVYGGRQWGISDTREAAYQQVSQQAQKEKAEYDAATKAQLDAMSKKLDELTPPPGPDPKSPPPHDSLFYQKQLKSKVDKAKTPEEKEKAFWVTLCTTKRELVGNPTAIWEGKRAETYGDFAQVVWPYYVTLVYHRKVSFHTESMIEMATHYEYSVEHTSC